MTPRFAFVFPGQGAQQVGMGQDFYDASADIKAIYELFDANTSSDLSQVCFNGPEDTLKRTQYTQPAILATSLAALAAFQAKSDIKPMVSAGHSLGEYGALFASGAITLEQAAKLIGKRAELMEAAPNGAMAVILGLDSDAIYKVIEPLNSPEKQQYITIANDNSDVQKVISGSPELVEHACVMLKEVGAKRVLPLPVGGAFHSPLMNQAAETFKSFVEEFEFKDSEFPVITNIDAEATIDNIQFRQKLAHQINNSVLWTQTMTTMVNEFEITDVIEFGPGKVLTGLFKKSHPNVRLHNVNSVESLNTTLNALQPACSVS